MSIEVDCSRVGCGAIADIGGDGDWSELTLGYDIFADLDYGARIVVALPQGWTVDRASSGDAVIHCPDHAAPR